VIKIKNKKAPCEDIIPHMAFFDGTFINAIQREK
jgi:hypothetical protein